MNSTSGRSLGVYSIKKGLAEEMGARDMFGQGFGFSRFTDIGLNVTGWWEADRQEEKIKREPYPAGHRYFPDCLRESTALLIVRLVHCYQRIFANAVALPISDVAKTRKLNSAEGSE